MDPYAFLFEWLGNNGGNHGATLSWRPQHHSQKAFVRFELKVELHYATVGEIR